MSLLTAMRLRSLIRYDPETGLFTNLVTRGSRAIAGAIAGSPDADGYLQIKIDGENLKAHRLAFLYMTGEWPVDLVDHRNGVVSDNRWDNLRNATPITNSQNKHKAYSSNELGILGVSYDKARCKYIAQLAIEGRQTNLGRFDTAAAAEAAYIAAKRLHHEGNTL